MWENGNEGTPKSTKTRSVRISKSLHDAIQCFVDDKGCKKQGLFDAALISLWEMYNGYTESNEPVSPDTKIKVRSILNDNPMPTDKNSNSQKKKYLWVHFKDEHTFEWARSLERLRMFNGLDNFVRRVVSWYLRDGGYLPEIKKRISRIKMNE